MTKKKKLESEKREELYKGITQIGVSYEEAKKIFNSLEDECIIEITAPQVEESPLQSVIIKATHTGRFSGNSDKPGNIILNIKNAMNSTLTFTVSTITALASLSGSQSHIIILTIFSAILSAANFVKINLDNNAILILAVLWENKHTYSYSIDTEIGLELVNTYLASNNREKLSDRQYNDSLDDLEKIGSIAISNGKIKLKEKIYIKY